MSFKPLEKEWKQNLTQVLKETSNMPKTYEETIQQLEIQNEELRRRLWKHKRKPSGKVAYVLLFSGAAALVWSVIYTSYAPAFIGISLTFWGALLLFIKPGRYVKADLLASTAIFTFANINRIIKNMNYKGKGIYLPPQYSKGFQEGKVFIPANEKNPIPKIEECPPRQEEVFLEDPKGMCLTPSGLDLTNMFEEELGIDFTKTNIEYLQNKLPKVFVEGLEIAKTFEMKRLNNNISVQISNSIYGDFCHQAKRLTKNACSSFACPLCSSIACALTRVTGKPVIIKENAISDDWKTMHVQYQILGTIEKVSTPSKPAIRYPADLFPRLVGLVAATVGSVILAWVGWLTWYDITTWNKSFALIFFASRAGEAMSLGIDMRAIHYLLIGLVLFFPSVLLFFRKRQLSRKED